MAYRNGTYVAFDGQDTTEPTKSDIKYFNMLNVWKKIAKKESLHFEFSDSHKKTSQVKDTSNNTTCKAKLLDRLKSYKNMLLILSDDTRHDRELLNYEIGNTIDVVLPIIICYSEVEKPILNPADYYDYWPRALTERMNKDIAKCLHIPFKKIFIFDAISRFSKNKENVLTSFSCFKQEHYNNLLGSN